jgi:hypothetical protein|nr:MAG TPA: Protein of unknown function (DUF2612) [Caudoviricetes sp.]
MILSRIPHIYHDTIFSKKMFEISLKKQEHIRKLYNQMSNLNDINKCNGYLLDVLGKNFKINREGRNDDEYRKIIKFFIITTQFMGSIEEIKNILSLYFGIEKDSFFITELSGKILITVDDSMDKKEVIEAIKKIKTAGVGFKVDYEIYIEDFLVSELEEMTLDEIKKITIARR